MTNGSIITRIGKKFNQEIEEIKNKRILKGLSKKSTKAITNQIIKHRDWEKIKEDTINFKFENE